MDIKKALGTALIVVLVIFLMYRVLPANLRSIITGS